MQKDFISDSLHVVFTECVSNVCRFLLDLFHNTLCIISPVTWFSYFHFEYILIPNITVI